MFDPQALDDCLGTLALTRLLVRSVDRPVIAAGGMMDGAGIAACLLLGAVAAQLGTAFVGRQESQADPGYQAALFGPAAGHTVDDKSDFRSRPPGALRTSSQHRAKLQSKCGDSGLPRRLTMRKQLNAAAKAAGDGRASAPQLGRARCDRFARKMSAGMLVAELHTELERALARQVTSKCRTIPSRADRLVGFEHAGRRQASRR